MSGLLLRSSSNFSPIQRRLTLFNSLIRNISGCCYEIWSSFRNCECLLLKVYSMNSPDHSSLKGQHPYHLPCCLVSDPFLLDDLLAELFHTNSSASVQIPLPFAIPTNLGSFLESGKGNEHRNFEKGWLLRKNSCKHSQSFPKKLYILYKAAQFVSPR